MSLTYFYFLFFFFVTVHDTVLAFLPSCATGIGNAEIGPDCETRLIEMVNGRHPHPGDKFISQICDNVLGGKERFRANFGQPGLAAHSAPRL